MTDEQIKSLWHRFVKLRRDLGLSDGYYDVCRSLAVLAGVSFDRVFNLCLDEVAE